MMQPRERPNRRWSELPPGACSHFKWLKQFHLKQSALSAAVAQLELVR